jgi:anti-sigma regulatory factor (Ser/Thr protein kinase)
MQQAFARSLDELTAIVAATAAFFDREGLPASLRNRADLCIEELFVNMVTYNTESKEDILLQLETRGHGLRICLTDTDVDRFDPRQGPPVDTLAPIEHREPGGLGLYLVMKMASEIRYAYRDRTSTIILDLEADNHV